MDECAICCNATIDTWLACGHSICHSCLRALVVKRLRKCPFCKERVTYTLAMIERHIKLLSAS